MKLGNEGDYVMNVNYYELASGWILNFLDFVMLYILTNSLLGYRSNVAFKKITLKTSVFALAFGLAMGTFGHFVDIRIHNAIVTIAMIGVIHFVSKKVAHISFPDKVLIVVIYHIIGHLIVIPLFAIANPLNLEPIYRNLLIYVLMMGIIFLLCLMIDLNKLFIFVTRKILVKIMFFCLTVIFAALFAIFSFNTYYILESGVLLIVFMTISINCLYLSLKNAHEYMEVMPNTYHDTKELLAIFNHKLADMNDVDEVKKAYEKIMHLMNLKASEASPNNENEFENLILNTIESIKANKESQIHVMTEIDYYEPHPVIEDIDIAYMLGILFKNAIESLTRKPICVDVISSKYMVMIKISNEAKHKSKEEMESMLMKNYSTKSHVGRGYGLAKLKKKVEKDKGKINIYQEFNHQEQVNYLSVMIKF